MKCAKQGDVVVADMKLKLNGEGEVVGIVIEDAKRVGSL